MSDFTGNFFLDPGITIKEERDEIMTTSSSTASVPIPTSRRIMEIGEYRDFDLDNSQSPLYQDTTLPANDPFEICTTTMWGNRMIFGGGGGGGVNDDTLKNEVLMHMDDDDIFQVDKADLIQGPTLAELNANDDYLGDLNFDDLLLPEPDLSQRMQSTTPFQNLLNTVNNNSSSAMVTASSSCPQTSMLFYKDLDLSTSVPINITNHSNLATLLNNVKTPTASLSPFSQASQNSSPQLQSSPIHQPKHPQHTALHDLLMRETYISPERTSNTLPSGNNNNNNNTSGGSVVGGINNSVQSGRNATSPVVRGRSHASRLSSSAPNRLGLAELWQRREPRKHLCSTGSLAEAGSTSSLSTGGILSPDPQDFSHDEFDSDDESDADHHYEDMSSDNDSDDDEHPNNSKSSHSKKERFFWQYNVQAKGPKGQRLVMKSKMEDPHVLHEVTDPVFSPDCSVRGIKHSGKARKGDGNDLTPNAKKLYTIGKELDKLGRIINDMTPVSELPFNVRPKSRKEKNKLASRACRLKKKAQHEANKIKLNGLEAEHRNLLNGIAQSRELVMTKLQSLPPEKQEELSNHLENIAKMATRVKVAGSTTDYVNKILDKLKKGQSFTIAEDGSMNLNH